MPLFRSLALATIVGGAVVLPRLTAQDVLHGVLGGRTLVRIDTATLAATAIGTIGFSSVGGLTFGNDGTLFGLSTSGTDTLVRVDRNSGVGTAVGPVGVPTNFSTGMANDPTTDTLVAVTGQGTGYSSMLVTLSKQTGGVLTTIGDTMANAIVGLDFDGAGQLWGIDGGGGNEELIRIDVRSAALTRVGPQGLAQYPNIGCFDVGPSGTLWAINSGSAGPELLSIDANSGSGTNRGVLTGLASGVLTGLTSDSTLTGSGPGRPGTAVSFLLNAPSQPGRAYQLASSLGTGPIAIDSRRLGLSVDALLIASTQGTLPTVFSGYAGVLSARGRGNAALNLPPIAQLVGLTIYNAFITVDAQAPSSVGLISNTWPFTVAP